MPINCRELSELVDRFEGLVGHQVCRLRTEDPPMYGPAYFQPRVHCSRPPLNRFRQYGQWNSNAWVSSDHQPLRGLRCMSPKLKYLLCVLVETLHEMTSGSFCFTPSQALQRVRKRKQRLCDARQRAALFEKQLHKFVNPKLVTSLNRRTAKASCDAAKIVKLISKLRKQALKSARCPDKRMNCMELMVKLKTMLVRQKCEWQCVGRLKETITIAGEMKAILKFLTQLTCLLNNTTGIDFQRRVPERPPSYEITCGLTDDSLSNFNAQRMGDTTFDLSGMLDNTDLISSISPCLLNAGSRRSQSGITISLSFDLDGDDEIADDDDDDDHYRHHRRSPCRRTSRRRPSSGRTESLDRSYRERGRDYVRKEGNQSRRSTGRPVCQGPSQTITVSLSSEKTQKSPARPSSKGKKQKCSQSLSPSPRQNRLSSGESRSPRKEKKCVSSPKRTIIISTECGDDDSIVDQHNGDEYESPMDEDEPKGRGRCKQHKTFHASSPPKSKPRKKSAHESTSPKKRTCPCENKSSISPKVSRGYKKQQLEQTSPKKPSSKFDHKKRCKQQSLPSIEESESQTNQMGKTEDVQHGKRYKNKEEECEHSNSEGSSDGDSCSSSANCSETIVIKSTHHDNSMKTYNTCQKNHHSRQSKNTNFGISLTSNTSGESREPLIMSSREMRIDIDEMDCDPIHVCGCQCEMCGGDDDNNLHYSPKMGRMKMDICLEEQLNDTECPSHSCESSTESTQSQESDEDCPQGGKDGPSPVTYEDKATSPEDFTLQGSEIPYTALSKGRYPTKDARSLEEAKRRTGISEKGSLMKDFDPDEAYSERNTIVKEELYAEDEFIRSPEPSIVKQEELYQDEEQTREPSIVKQEELYQDEETRVEEEVRQSFYRSPPPSPRRSVVGDEDRQSQMSALRQIVEDDGLMWYETAKGRRDFLKKWWKFLLLLLLNLYLLYLAWCVVTSPTCWICNSGVPNFLLHFITSAKRSVRLIHFSPAPV